MITQRHTANCTIYTTFTSKPTNIIFNLSTKLADRRLIIINYDSLMDELDKEKFPINLSFPWLAQGIQLEARNLVDHRMDRGG